MAVKTEQEIERDFYAMVKASSLGASVSGGIHRSGMRPSNSSNEDIIIKMLSGTSGQVQRGIVIFDIYVPDVDYDGRKVVNHERIAELQTLVNDFVGSQASGEYKIRFDETPRTESQSEIEQHYIYVRIHFERLTI